MLNQSSRDEEEITNEYKEYEEALEMNKGYSTEQKGDDFCLRMKYNLLVMLMSQIIGLKMLMFSNTLTN